MTRHPQSNNPNPESAPPSADREAVEGYDEWLAAEIEEGSAELDAGKGIPADQVWKDLGLE